MPNDNEHRATSTTVEAARLRLIQQRLRSQFYECPPVSTRIAASVLAELQDLEESSAVTPS